jgi:hypothetical protein
LCDRCVALQVLGLEMHASAARIENSYQMLVKVWHPDRFQTDPKMRLAAEEKLKEINVAHEFLISPASAQDRSPATSRPKPPEAPEERFKAPADTASVVPDVEEPEPDEVRRILKRQRKKRSLPRFLLNAGFAVGAIATVALLWLVIDSILSSNPRTAGAWDQHKAEVSRAFQSNMARLWANAADNLHNQKDQNSTPVGELPAPPSTSAPAPESSASAAPRPVGGPPHIKVSGPGQGALPYVTSGLTPTEVLAILGNPTSSSGEKMFYEASEIDFRNGRVAGWRIDPKTAPIRVKLWPDTAPTPGLSYFTIGSSKSDVIELQGTPTLFSDNKFGYGNSVVLFQNDRVSGWNEDPGSVRLRVAH